MDFMMEKEYYMISLMMVIIMVFMIKNLKVNLRMAFFMDLVKVNYIKKMILLYIYFMKDILLKENLKEMGKYIINHGINFLKEYLKIMK